MSTHFSPKKYSKKIVLSSKNISPVRSSSFTRNNTSKYLSSLSLLKHRNFYKKNVQKYNQNLVILNYIMNCAEKNFSTKTGISASNQDYFYYDSTMINKYEEDLNSSLSYISDFVIEQKENSENSFDSEIDDDSFEEIEINTSKNKISKNELLIKYKTAKIN